MHPPALIPFRHLLMDNAAARGHPLDVPRPDGPAVPHAVGMFHIARQHIRNGFDSPVRMPRKALEILRRNVGAKIVQQQERVEIGSIAEAKRTAQMDTGAFTRRLRFNQAFHGTK